MIRFDPEFALEVMRRRQGDLNKRAAAITLEKFWLQVEYKIPMWGGAADAMDKEIHKLWDQAESYNAPIDYLRKRIWDSKTFAEKVWEIIKDWDHDPSNFGVKVVEDVIEAQQNVALGWRA